MKILIAVTDLHDGQLAAQFIQRWLAPKRHALHLIHVLEPPPVLSDLAQTIFTNWKDQASKNARRLLVHLTQTLSSRGLRVRSCIAHGEAKATLLEFISNQGIDMTVVAPHRNARLKRLFLGSVSETLLHNSPTSVLIVRERARRRVNRRTVVIGLDGSASAKKAANRVLKAHGSRPCHIILIHVLEPPDTLLDRMARMNTELPRAIQRATETRKRRIRYSLDRTASYFAAQGHSVETMTVTGVPSTKIMDVARRYGADLVALGSRGLGTFERYALGSVSSKVARFAECSVLVVK